jgi:hypothetical protein
VPVFEKTIKKIKRSMLRIRPDPGEWHPRMPERLDEEELADSS